jgi:hypothetical protein
MLESFGEAPVDMPVARSIEFTEKDFLPLSEDWAPVINKERERRSNQRGHDMGRRISLSMLVGEMPWNQVSQACQDICTNVGIGPFVDGQSRRRVGIEEGAETAINPGGPDNIFNMCCYVNHFHVG